MAMGLLTAMAATAWLAALVLEARPWACLPAWGLLPPAHTAGFFTSRMRHA